jgi:hypothetical protein
MYGLDLFVRVAIGDSLKWDCKHDDHVDLICLPNCVLDVMTILTMFFNYHEYRKLFFFFEHLCLMSYNFHWDLSNENNAINKCEINYILKIS